MNSEITLGEFPDSKVEKMPELFQYHDYRQYLKDYYEEKKKISSYFSYRYIGQKLGLDHSFIVKILMGKRHIKESHIPSLCNLCKLEGKEAEYFETLVHFTKARSDSQIKLYFEKLMSLKSVKHYNIHESQYEYFHKWYYAAIRSALEILPVNENLQELADFLNPSITLQQAEESISLLQKLELIEKDEDGVFVLTKNHLTTVDRWSVVAIKNYQKEVIKMSAESLDRDHKSQRDISTITMAIERDKLPILKEMLKDFREGVINQVDEMDSPDAVYQLNLQLIPQTQPNSSTGGLDE